MSGFHHPIDSQEEGSKNHYYILNKWLSYFFLNSSNGKSKSTKTKVVLGLDTAGISIVLLNCMVLANLAMLVQLPVFKKKCFGGRIEIEIPCVTYGVRRIISTTQYHITSFTFVAFSPGCSSSACSA